MEILFGLLLIYKEWQEENRNFKSCKDKNEQGCHAEDFQ
jgi:hypothetical protein